MIFKKLQLFREAWIFYTPVLADSQVKIGTLVVLEAVYLKTLCRYSEILVSK